MAVDVKLEDSNGWVRSSVTLPLLLGEGAYADLAFSANARGRLVSDQEGDDSCIEDLDHKTVLERFPRLCSIDPVGDVEFRGTDAEGLVEEIDRLLPYLVGLDASLYRVLGIMAEIASRDKGFRILAVGD